MKKSKAETAETRKRIVEIASQEFKRKGIQAASVSEIMAAAGLTHGGFYRHFKSKEHLLAEACSSAMVNMAEQAEAALGGGIEAIEDYFDEFLTMEKHEDDAAACVFVTMGSEIARADELTRHTMSEGLRAWIEILARQDSESPDESTRGDAMFRLSAMIGAVTMSRIVDDQEFADRLLDETRTRLVHAHALSA